MTCSTTIPGNRGCTSNELLCCLREMFRSEPIAVANKRDFLNLYTESDYVVATLSGQVYEFEIKITRNDFARDFHKMRNQIYRGEKEGRKPNRFYYVTAKGIVDADCIPGFAGWFEWQDGKLERRKPAPLLHHGCLGVDVLMRLARAMRERGAQ